MEYLDAFGETHPFGVLYLGLASCSIEHAKISAILGKISVDLFQTPELIKQDLFWDSYVSIAKNVRSSIIPINLSPHEPITESVSIARKIWKSQLELIDSEKYNYIYKEGIEGTNPVAIYAERKKIRVVYLDKDNVANQDMQQFNEKNTKWRRLNSIREEEWLRRIPLSGLDQSILIVGGAHLDPEQSILPSRLLERGTILRTLSSNPKH